MHNSYDMYRKWNHFDNHWYAVDATGPMICPMYGPGNVLYDSSYAYDKTYDISYICIGRVWLISLLRYGSLGHVDSVFKNLVEASDPARHQQN